ncbi:MAG: hypothetical protein V2A66_01965 [Pseudomonadota bacterium]
MKKNLFGFIVMFALAAVVAGCGGGGGSGSSTDNDPASQTFTSGSNSLTADTTTSGSTKTTAVTNSSGTTVLTMALTVNGVSLTFPGQTSTADTTFSEALPEMPSNFAASVLATYIAGQVSGFSANTSARSTICATKDSPGCDWFPDTQCTLGCCADHDYCYDLNGCSASSWLIIGQSSECINCNGIAEYCISRACAGVDSSRTSDRCYDNRCHQFYDCGEADCYTCTSPCDSVSPAACTSTSFSNCCGNGTCELGETQTNCPADCKDGAGYNQCCYSSSDCPSEELYTCPGACCCCGSGEVCTRDGSHVCTGSASISVKDSAPFSLKIPADCVGKPKSECR